MTSYVPVIVLTQYNVDSVAEKTRMPREELWAMLKAKTDAGQAAVVKIPVIDNPGVLPKTKMITPEYEIAQEEWVKIGYKEDGMQLELEDYSGEIAMDVWDT